MAVSQTSSDVALSSQSAPCLYRRPSEVVGVSVDCGLEQQRPVEALQQRLDVYQRVFFQPLSARAQMSIMGGCCSCLQQRVRSVSTYRIAQDFTFRSMRKFLLSCQLGHRSVFMIQPIPEAKLVLQSSVVCQQSILIRIPRREWGRLPSQTGAFFGLPSLSTNLPLLGLCVSGVVRS